MPTRLLSAFLLAALLVLVGDPPPADRAGDGSSFDDRAFGGGGFVAEADMGWPVAGLQGTGFGWPVAGARLVRRFDPPERPWLSGHRGVDLDATPSAVVSAAGEGTIVYAGPIAGRGVVSVLHPGGLRTTYEPVDAHLRVGEVVRAGQAIGILASGHPGCPTRACLHWGLRRGDQYLDPLLLLGLGKVRLLPL